MMSPQNQSGNVEGVKAKAGRGVAGVTTTWASSQGAEDVLVT